MLFLEMEKIEFSGGHIGIMVFLEMDKIELNGGHIEIMLFIEMEKKRNLTVAILELC